jgi:hypothetical protein
MFRISVELQIYLKKVMIKFHFYQKQEEKQFKMQVKKFVYKAHFKIF